MAVAKMKKLTIQSSKKYEDKILEAIQEFNNIELIGLDQTLKNEMQDSYTGHQPELKIDELSQKLNQTEKDISFLEEYVTDKKASGDKNTYTISELEELFESFNLEELHEKIDSERKLLASRNYRLDEIDEEEELLRKWSNLDFVPNQTKDFHMFNIYIGSVRDENTSEFKEGLDNIDNLYYEEIFSLDDESGYGIIVHRGSTNTFKNLTNAIQFSNLKYNYKDIPKVELENIIEEARGIKTDIQEQKNNLTQYHEELEHLYIAEEYLYNYREREKAKVNVYNSDSYFLLSVWATVDDAEALHDYLKNEIGTDEFLIEAEDVREEEIDDVPIVLKNNKLVEPLENITTQYSYPKYGEKDPTSVLWFFHLFFFGLMSADLGYGLVLFLGTLFVLYKVDMKKSTRNVIKMFNQMSVATMIVGLVYGSFFGFSLPFQLVDVLGDIVGVMIFSVALGLVHMLVALLIRGKKTLEEKDYASFYLDSAMWIMVIAGAAILAINAFAVNNDLLGNIGLWLILGNLIGMILVNIISSENKLAGLGKGAFGVMDFTSYLGDAVSYTRLAALGVSGGSIALAFNIVIGLLPPAIRFTLGAVLFVLLHALNAFITFLGAYVHSMRLEYVEFFGKFYEGGGRPIEPLATLEKNMYINRK